MNDMRRCQFTLYKIVVQKLSRKFELVTFQHDMLLNRLGLSEIKILKASFLTSLESLLAIVLSPHLV